jgi:Tfp pilus assembly protein PilP
VVFGRAPLEVTGGPKGLTVSSTRLTGIVRSQRGVFALLEGSDGIGYILRPGDTLGDGRLIEIDADSAVFTVVPRPGAPPNRVTLRLKTDS